MVDMMTPGDFSKPEDTLLAYIYIWREIFLYNNEGTSHLFVMKFTFVKRVKELYF